jgi:hypothetical protein
MAHDVFISHSAKDKTIADAVCATLEAEGIRCWIAPRDVVPGMEFAKCIIEAIKHARVMVLVFTANANDSSQVRREVERAFSHGVAVLPFRLETPVLHESLEYFFGNVHWLDALTPPLEGHLNILANKVKALQAQAGTPHKRAEPHPVIQISAQNEGKAANAAGLHGESPVAAGKPELVKRQFKGTSPDSSGGRATAETPKPRRIRVWVSSGAVALVVVLAAIFLVRYRMGWGSAGSPTQVAQPVAAGGSVGAGSGQGGNQDAQQSTPSGPNPASAPASAPSPSPDGGAGDSSISMETQDLAGEANRLILQNHYSEARPLAAQACDGGSETSCINLGKLYDTGHGVGRDYSRAASLYQRACEGGSAEGCFDLGADYDAGKGVAQDYAQGAYFYKLACDGGSAEGCGGLGELYAKGLGVPQDSAKETTLLQKACSGGDQQSCDQLTKLK